MAPKNNVTSDGKKGGWLKGKRHSAGGMKAIVVDTGTPIEVEGGEIIIERKAAKEHCEELSKINQSGGGVAIPCDVSDSAKSTFGDGGPISELQIGKYYNHPIFGKGELMKIDENGNVLELSFDVGHKRLLSKFSRLTELSTGNDISQNIEIKQPEVPFFATPILVPTTKKEPKVASAKKASAKKTIKDIVVDNSELLKGMKTHTELRDWAIKQGFDNRSAFPKFKTALNEIGLDYDGIKNGINKSSQEKLENEITHSVTMYCDAKASAGRFGITDEDGNVLWHGRFFEDDDAEEQSRAELSAAKKAVWLAGKVKESIGAKAIEFNLIIDAQWLTYQTHGGQKGYALTVLARKYNIKLNVQWIPGKDNPADEWTIANGYKKWQDNDLKALAIPIEKTTEIFSESEIENKTSKEILTTRLKLVQKMLSKNPSIVLKARAKIIEKMIQNSEQFRDGGLIHSLNQSMAIDHLKEDSHYYTKLNKMKLEQGAKLEVFRQVKLVDDNTEEPAIYYVVGKQGENFKIVISDNFDLWRNASEIEKHEYYEDIAHPSEIEPMLHKIKQNEFGLGGPVGTNTEYDKAVSDLDKAEKLQNIMKTANAIIRSKKNVTARLVSEAGLTESNAYQLQQPDYGGRVGFATYKLTNNNATIKRLQERVKMLEGKLEGAEKGNVTYEFEKDGGGTVEVNYDIDRVQIIYNSSRVSHELFKELRSNGYVFSRTNSAFQRKITPQAIRNALHFTNAKMADSKESEIIVEQDQAPAPEIGIASEEVIYPNSQNEADLDIDESYDVEKGRKLKAIFESNYNDKLKYRFDIKNYSMMGLKPIIVFANGATGEIDLTRQAKPESFSPSIREKLKGISEFLLSELSLSKIDKFNENQINNKGEFMDNLHPLDMWVLFGDGRWYRKFQVPNDNNVRELTDAGIKERMSENNGIVEAIISVRSESEADMVSKLYMELYPNKSNSDYQKELKRQSDAGEIENEDNGISLYHLSKNIQKEKEVETPKEESRTEWLKKQIANGEKLMAKISFTGDITPDINRWKAELAKLESAPKAYKPQTLKEYHEGIHNAGIFVPNMPVKEGGYTIEEAEKYKADYIKLQSLNYDENGNPIGIEPKEYVEITSRLEKIESGQSETIFKGVSHEYKNQYVLNKAIEELLDSKTDNNSFSSDEKNFIRKYSGYGGLDKYGTTGKGGLFEFYTPSEIIEKMWALAYKFGYDNGPILEPSIGTGEFLRYAPKDVRVVGYDISRFSARICKILYPNTEINIQPFEQIFIKNNYTVKDKTDHLEKYKLIIGNPPYGDFSIVESRYMSGMGEKDFTKARNYVEYFIRRGVDLLESGGLLIYIVGSQLKAGGKMFLDGEMTPVKEWLMENANFETAYRLPDSVFERTGVTADIIVLRKK